MIRDKILEISEYFVALNYINNVCYIIVKFPEKWKMPKKLMNGQVSMETKDGNLYLITDAKNGEDILFEGAKSIISLNKILKEKSDIFTRFVNELKKLINETNIEKLRNLKLVFEDGKNNSAPFEFDAQIWNEERNSDAEKSDTVETNSDEEKITECNNEQDDSTTECTENNSVSDDEVDAKKGKRVKKEKSNSLKDFAEKTMND